MATAALRNQALPAHHYLILDAPNHQTEELFPIEDCMAILQEPRHLRLSLRFDVANAKQSSQRSNHRNRNRSKGPSSMRQIHESIGIPEPR